MFLFIIRNINVRSTIIKITTVKNKNTMPIMILICHIKTNLHHPPSCDCVAKGDCDVDEAPAAGSGSAWAWHGRTMGEPWEVVHSSFWGEKKTRGKLHLLSVSSCFSMRLTC